MKNAQINEEQTALLEVLAREFNEDKNEIASVIFELGLFFVINVSNKNVNAVEEFLNTEELYPTIKKIIDRIAEFHNAGLSK